MHIPSAGPMKPELLEDAFARAEAFFKEYFPKDYRVFGVESWLIDPDLVQILPEGNMKAYARRFHLIDTEKSDEIFPDGWRVFHFLRSDVRADEKPVPKHRCKREIQQKHV